MKHPLQSVARLLYFGLSIAADPRLASARDEATATLQTQETSTPTGATWSAAAPYPTGIARYAFAQNGQDLYVISGVSNGVGVTAVRRYNATTNVWTSLANIPSSSDAPAGVYYDGKIYVANGTGGNQFFIYDVASNNWTTGPPRPGVSSSVGAAAGAFGGKIYIVGGGVGGTNILSIYNIATNTWSTGPVAPSPFQLGGFAQIGPFLYMVGSFATSQVTMRLAMDSNTWTTGPAWTPARFDIGLAAVGSKLVALGGGTDAFEPSAQVDELDVRTWPSGAWVPSPDNLPSPRNSCRAGFFTTGRAAGEIWSTGGVIAPSNTYFNDHLFRTVNLPCPDYSITETRRTLVPATMDVGNHCDDCVTSIALPFPITLYGVSYTTANASSNGNLQFGSANPSSGNTQSLPAAGFGTTIFAFWNNVRTSAAGNGIFTSLTGTAPNRVFTVEWRVSPIIGSGTSNFEVRFREDSPDFELVYGVTTLASFDSTIGVQQSATGLSTQFPKSPSEVPPPGTRLLFSTGCCVPIAFSGAVGSGSDDFPGTSGSQTGRIFQTGEPSVCGTATAYPGTVSNTPRTYDQYTFTNSGPDTCVTFSVNTTCTSASTRIFLAAYSDSFNPANIETNYLGDIGAPPTAANPSRSFSVNVPENATVVLVVHQVDAKAVCNSYDIVVTGLSCPPAVTSAVSRKTHGSAGDFDIPLPLTGAPGVECRGSGGNHEVVFTFNSRVLSGQAPITVGAGLAGVATFMGPTMSVPLSGVTDLQKLTITLNNVTNDRGQTLPNTAINMNVLLGDTSGNKTVNASDIGQTKGQSGQAAGAANFRTDVNANGSINTTDIGQVKANSGHTLP